MSRNENFAQFTTNSSRVSIRNVSKAFQGQEGLVRVLDDMSIEVEPGEMLVLLGPSGCGKTTLLRSLAGLERPDTGEIHVDKTTLFSASKRTFLPPHKRGIGMVFQNYALWPHMTVLQNVQFPLHTKSMQPAVSAKRAAEALEIVQCSHLSDRYPPQLSGGQQQRVSLARAIASQPSVLLLDEPLSNLDALLRHELRTQLRQIHRELNFTGVYVTHDQIEAMNLASKVIVLNKGKIAQEGPPEEIYHQPSTEFVAEFLGLRNRLPCTISEGKIAGIGTNLAAARLPFKDGGYVLRFRPSAVSLINQATPEAGDEAAFLLRDCRIVEILHSGETMDYVLEAGGVLFYAECRSRQPFVRGETVTASIKLADLRFYDFTSGELRLG